MTEPKEGFAVTLQLRAWAEPIPPGDGSDPVFVAWCKEKDVRPLNGGRRGWWPLLSSYIRGAEYLVGGQDLDAWLLMTQAELDELGTYAKQPDAPPEGPDRMKHAEVLSFKKAHDLVQFSGGLSDELSGLFGDCPPSSAPTQEIVDWFEEHEAYLRGFVDRLVLQSGTSYDLAWVALGAGCEDCNMHFAGVWGGQYAKATDWCRAAEQHFNTDNIYELFKDAELVDQEVG